MILTADRDLLKFFEFFSNFLLHFAKMCDKIHKKIIET